MSPLSSVWVGVGWNQNSRASEGELSFLSLGGAVRGTEYRTRTVCTRSDTRRRKEGQFEARRQIISSNLRLLSHHATVLKIEK